MIRFEPYRSSFYGFARTLRASVNYADLHLLYRDARDVIRNILSTDTLLRLRIIICLQILFVKRVGEDEIEQSFYFCSYAERILSVYQINEAIQRAFQKIFQSASTFVRGGSGWVLKRVLFIDLHIGRYRNLRGGCATITLPPKIKNKHALINVQCFDGRCFLYAVCAKLYPVKKHAQRCSKYMHATHTFNLKDIQFPFEIRQIKKFEKQNALKINIFGIENSDIFPIYMSKAISRKNEIDLLLYKNHYFLIKSFNRLLNAHRGVHHFCKNCLNGFQRESSLIAHKKVCLTNKPQSVRMPQDTTLKFTDTSKTIKHGVIVIADFETITVKQATALPSTSKSFNTIIETHEPVSYGFIVIDANDKILYHEYYAGSNVVSRFLNSLKRVAQKAIELIQINNPMQDNENIQYSKDTCCICGKKFFEG